MANYPSNLNVFREEREMLPEQRLWKAVLLQAIDDAFGNNQSQENHQAEKCTLAKSENVWSKTR